LYAQIEEEFCLYLIYGTNGFSQAYVV
jgi:hypothetical protein